tara:strand:+ start:1486 stop:1701 length:216 start_codon:yes stop_codon:yes gene_type:complete
MIDKIEKSLVDRVGSSILITLFLSFLFTVIFQSYVAKYQLAFLGFFVASLLVSILLFATWKLKEELENNEK